METTEFISEAHEPTPRIKIEHAKKQNINEGDTTENKNLYDSIQREQRLELSVNAF